MVRNGSVSQLCGEPLGVSLVAMKAWWRSVQPSAIFQAVEHLSNVRKITWVERKGRRFMLVLPKERTFEADDLPYTVSVRVDALEDGRPVCTSITMSRKAGGPGVGAQRMRTVPFRKLIGETLAAAATEGDEVEGSFWGWAVPDEKSDDVLLATQKSRRPGSPPVPEEDLRLAWQFYKEALERPQKRDHIAYTQRQLKRAPHEIHKGRSTVHSWIQMAKERNFDGEH